MTVIPKNATADIFVKPLDTLDLKLKASTSITSWLLDLKSSVVEKLQNKIIQENIDQILEMS